MPDTCGLWRLPAPRSPDWPSATFRAESGFSGVSWLLLMSERGPPISAPAHTRQITMSQPCRSRCRKSTAPRLVYMDLESWPLSFGCVLIALIVGLATAHIVVVNTKLQCAVSGRACRTNPPDCCKRSISLAPACRSEIAVWAKAALAQAWPTWPSVDRDGRSVRPAAL